MQPRWAVYATAVAMVLAGSARANATQINFTGGNAALVGGGIYVPHNSGSVQGVDYYEEKGFRLDFVFPNGSAPFTSIIGDYYNAGNDVIHAHWATGDFGDLMQIVVTKIDGTAFDLNYFVLTSNTDTGGAAASGNERAFITASNGFSKILPPENWGFPATQIFLDSNFDNITSFTFTVTNPVDCFGMDNFFIDEPPPPPDVPEPATTVLLGLGLLGGMRARNRRRP